MSTQTRAQTTLDFAIGISLFLAVVLFTFGFIPTILDPFDATDSENPAVADRTADHIAHHMLGNASEPHILDRYCTVAFFQGTDFDGDDLAGDLNLSDICNFEEFEEPTFEDTHPVEQALSLEVGVNTGTHKSVNVSITKEDSDGDRELLCWDMEREDEEPASPKFVTDCDDDDVTFAIGDEPQQGADTVISSRRIVHVGGQTATLEVVVW